MDQCRLLDWAYHEDWVQWFLQSITKGGPSGFGTIKLEKIVRADKKLWTLLAQRQTKSLRPSNDVPVLHESFKKLTTDPRVTLFVLPLPSSSRLVAAPEATPAPKNTAAPENNLQQEAVKKYTCVLRVKVTSVGASICRLVAQTLHHGHQQSAWEISMFALIAINLGIAWLRADQRLRHCRQTKIHKRGLFLVSPKLMTLLYSLNQLFLPSRNMRPNLQAQWKVRHVHQSNISGFSMEESLVMKSTLDQLGWQRYAASWDLEVWL